VQYKCAQRRVVAHSARKLTVFAALPLVCAADGDEGGRHQLIAASVGSDNKLYILKIQVGDKRWFKGVEKDAKGTFNSFTVV
jgi:hypothetical protein